MSSPAGSPGSGGRFGGRLWAVLGALGVLSLAGTTLFSAALDKGRDLLVAPVEVQVRETTATPNFWFPAARSPGEAPATDFPDGAFLRWARRAGGIPFGERQFDVVVRGKESTPVVISAAQVRVTDRRPLRPGWVNAWTGCGEPVPARAVMVDLGTSPPSHTVEVDGVRQDGALFTVTDSDVEVFQLTVRAGPGVQSWLLDVQYTADGEQGVSITREQDGRPFRLAGGGLPHFFTTTADGLVASPADRETYQAFGVVC